MHFLLMWVCLSSAIQTNSSPETCLSSVDQDDPRRIANVCPILVERRYSVYCCCNFTVVCFTVELWFAVRLKGIICMSKLASG